MGALPTFPMYCFEALKRGSKKGSRHSFFSINGDTIDCSFAQSVEHISSAPIAIFPSPFTAKLTNSSVIYAAFTALLQQVAPHVGQEKHFNLKDLVQNMWKDLYTPFSPTSERFAWIATPHRKKRAMKNSLNSFALTRQMS